MGFFTNFFGRKKPVSPPAETAVVPLLPPKAQLPLYEKVVELLVVSQTLKADLKQKLLQVFENPAVFYNEQDEFTLSERGLRYPKDVLLTPKFVLVDTLQEAGEMEEVDWKEGEEEVRFAINSIMQVKDFHPALSVTTRYEGGRKEGTFQILEKINQGELQPQGYALVLLDIDSDSYVFTVVLLEQQAEVEKLFKQL